MTINWNKMLPLIFVAVAGLAMLITGAVIGDESLRMVGVSLLSGAAGGAAPVNAITSRARESKP